MVMVAAVVVVAEVVVVLVVITFSWDDLPLAESLIFLFIEKA